SWLAKGPTITVTFRTADGIEPGKTLIRYKNVNVGSVTRVSFTKDGGVRVSAALSRDATEFVREDSQFWVVRPRVSAGGVSGLSTLFSGAYISFNAGRSAHSGREFRGLEIPPIDTEGLPGHEYVLHAHDAGSIQVGSPVLFRRVKAGQVIAYRVDPDGSGVTLRVFIDSPYEQFVTTAVRFWHASGIDLTLDAAGLRVQTQSAVTVLEGGLAFETPPDSKLAPLAPAGAQFELFSDRANAMRHPYTEIQHYRVYFKASLRGLSPGAPVDLHGIHVGEVSGFGFEYDQDQGIFRFPVDIDIYTEMLRERYIAGATRANYATMAGQRQIVDRLVAAGMRARLKSGSLVTGQLYIDLDFVPHAARTAIDWNTPRPLIPSVDAGLNELADKLGDIATKLDQVPVDQISAQLLKTLQELQNTLHGTSALVGHLNDDVAPEVTAALGNARQALKAVESTLSDASPLQSDLRDTLKQLSRSARTLADLSDYLEQHPESLIRGKPPDTK
ncbi:MAG: paraquat-inducible protein, partial [Gammaproteobacteria bacterium]|nr:paraquat-inducible protein [Gammaproteobacteria bacterium]